MPPAPPPARPRRRLVDGVIERLQQQVSLGILRPGDRLPTETELTEAFGVSRTTIREAVAVLEHAGLVVVRQGDGTYVADWTSGRESLDVRLQRAAALEVYEVRRPLEIEAARLAATRRTPSDVRRMRDLLAERAQLRATGDVAAAVATDLEFHNAVAMAAGNAVLTDLYRAFSGVLKQTLMHMARDRHRLPDTTDLHHALVDAIDRGDARGAAKTAERLIDADAAALRKALGERPATSTRRSRAND